MPKWALKLWSAVRAFKSATRGEITSKSIAELAVSFLVAEN